VPVLERRSRRGRHLNLSPPPAPRRQHGGRRRWRPHGPDPHRSRRLGNGDPAVTQSGRKRPQTAAMCHEPPALAESPQVQEITAHDAAHGSSPETRGCPGSNRVSPPQVREGPTQEASAARRFLPQTAHPFTPLVTARLDAPIATVEVGILGVFASGVFAGGVGVLELGPDGDRFQNASRGGAGTASQRPLGNRLPQIAAVS
jgi:hypothetical protein